MFKLTLKGENYGLCLQQDVIRNWYARDRTIVANCDGLYQNTYDCVEAFKKG